MSTLGRFFLVMMVLYPTALLSAIAEKVGALPSDVLLFIGIGFGLAGAAFVAFGGKE